MARSLGPEFAGAASQATSRGNLSPGLRQLNGRHAQRFNRRHGQAGRFFHGRRQAIVLPKDACLLELTRHVVLNRLRAGMVESLTEWRWSSFPAVIGQAAAPRRRNTDRLLRRFAWQSGRACKRCDEFVIAGWTPPSPLRHARDQWLLADKAFLEKYRQAGLRAPVRAVSKAHRQAIALPLDAYRARTAERDQATAPA